MLFLEGPIDGPEPAVADWEHLPARAADQVVVVMSRPAAARNHLEPRLAIAEFAPRHDPGDLEMPQAAEHGRPVSGPTKAAVDLVDR